MSSHVMSDFSAYLAIILPPTLMQIHGLTTAASIWLAASIGVAVGGGYYFISIYSVILIVKVLKYGPRIFYQKDDAARHESEEVGL